MALDPSYRRPAHIDLIHRKLAEVEAGSGPRRVIITMGPQEGKSESVTHYGALWALIRNPDRRVAIVSYEDETARRWGRAIRDDLENNQGDEGTVDLCLRLREDVRAAGRWQVQGHKGGVYCTGVGGALTGRPVDWLFIDDPVKGKAQADSEVERQKVWDWWQSVARTRIPTDSVVVIILTRWHQDDLAGRLMAQDDEREAQGKPRRWTVVNIPAQADHDPALGQTDPLGRAPGEWLDSARGRTTEDWEDIREDVGSAVFTALYQGRPSPAEGDLWQRAWWRHYPAPIWLEHEDGTRTVPTGTVFQSWDMAFKDTKDADFVVGQVWQHDGIKARLLDQVRARMTFTATVTAVEALRAKWPGTSAVLVEDKANGTAVLDTLKLRVPGLVPITPTESKQARAQAVSPFIEAGNVELPHPSLAAWVGDFIEEAAAFPNGTHDDQVDTTSQALARIYLGKQVRKLRMRGPREQHDPYPFLEPAPEQA
jgi:predicted phage terminase large subunit-like protein